MKARQITLSAAMLLFAAVTIAMPVALAQAVNKLDVSTPPHESPHTLTITNNGSEPVAAIYISSVNDPNWGNNWLSNSPSTALCPISNSPTCQVLGAHASTPPFPIPGGCQQDIKVVWVDKHYSTSANFDICSYDLQLNYSGGTQP
jgi:hypothetical protein